MTTHEVLVKARGLIEREEDWCQYALEMERDDGGTSRCALGAVKAACGLFTPVYQETHAVLTHLLGGAAGSISRFNNTRSHAEVLAAFDKAIAATAPEPDTSFLNEAEAEVEEPVAS